MRVGIVVRGPYPSNMVRIDLGARSLAEAGHEVSIFALREPGQAALEPVGNVTVHRAPYRPDQLTVLERWNVRLSHRVEALTFHSPFWRGLIRRFLEEHRIDLLHLHHLHLAGDGSALAGERGIPVVLDLHENRPYQIAYYARERGDRLFSRLFVNGRWRWSLYEGWAVKRADRTVVVVDEAKERLVRMHGVPPDRISVIPNVVDAERFRAHPVDPAIVERYRDDLLLLYIGSYQTFRGLDTLIDALALCSSELPSARLLIVGWPNPPSLKGALQDQARRRGVGDRVTFIDGEAPERIPSYIAASRVCVVPHHTNEQTEATIPYKLFEFMACGRAVLVSSCRPLARVVEETGAGKVFRAGDPEDAARCIRALGKGDLARELGGKGVAGVEGKYNWKRAGAVLTRLYEELASHRTP